MDQKAQREHLTFIRNRIREDFEAVCPTPRKCAAGMLPVTCEDCSWDADYAIAEAEEAARKLESGEVTKSNER